MNRLRDSIPSEGSKISISWQFVGRTDISSEEREESDLGREDGTKDTGREVLAEGRRPAGRGASEGLINVNANGRRG